MRLITVVPFMVASICFSSRGGEQGSALDWAKENVEAGRYAEAVDLLQKELPKLVNPSVKRSEAALALIDALRIVGKLDEAQSLCDELLAAKPKDPALRSLKAELDVEAGKYEEARGIWDALIKENPDNQRAWALRVLVLRIFNDRAALKATADHFYDLYDKNADYFQSDKVKDPLELAYIGLGVQFENAKTAFEEAFNVAEDLAEKRKLKLPEIVLWSARLAHEKYSFANAERRYQALLKMRPKLPDALSGEAAIRLVTTHELDKVEQFLKDALAVNPNHVDSHLLYAAVNLEEERDAEAKKHIDAALAVNPNQPHALALLAVYYLDQNQPVKVQEAEQRAMKLCPHGADFYCDIGEMLENKRRFNVAGEFYEKGLKLDPESWRPYYGLGMSASRQGAQDEERGKDLLLKAFERNKFNLWALNMIKALDRLIGDKEQNVRPVYRTAQTQHFTLKFFNKEAAIVRPYFEEWAESAYARQAKLFGFEPTGPLTIELCYSFEDQAARTVGLPNLGALGVCFGKLCTIVSPREGGTEGTPHPPFNWRKVIEHEYGHVMVLQMSDFKVPRWYTEAFSTYLEDDTRIQMDSMMADAIAKDQLKNIETMNEYFRTNPLMAYVHGRYIIEYIDKTFGFGAHLKAIKAFADGKSVEQALTEATGKDLKTLNEGQLAFVKNVFKSVRPYAAPDEAGMLKVQLAARADHAPAQAHADLAVAYVLKNALNEAGNEANKALELDPKCVDALNVLGAIAFQQNDFERAKRRYVESTEIDPERSVAAWRKLGAIYKKEGRTTLAIKSYETARKYAPRYVGPENPYHELPELYAELDPPQFDKALDVWRDAIRVNSEDADAALQGMKLAEKMKDLHAVIEFATRHLEIDPYKIEPHRTAGRAYEELNDLPHAEREFQVATAIEATDVESWIGLARVQKASGENDEALISDGKALEIDGTNAEAKALKQELTPK